MIHNITHTHTTRIFLRSPNMVRTQNIHMFRVYTVYVSVLSVQLLFQPSFDAL